MAIYKTNIVDIELERGNIHRSFLNQAIGLMDNSADRFGIHVLRNGSPVELTGCSCQGFFRNAEGTNIALTSYGTVDGGTAFITLPQACYNVDGPFTLAIKLVGGGVTGTMRIVDGVVDNTNASGTVAPTESVPTYQEIIAQYDEMVAATEAAEAVASNGMMAVTFKQANEYAAGKYVVREGKLYRLTADHAANASWSQTQKVQVNMGDEVTALNTATADLPTIRTNIAALQAEDQKIWEDNEKQDTTINDLVYYYGDPGEAEITLIGEVVNYRYQQDTRTDTQTSMRFTLPENVKTLRLTMHALIHMNSYTFLDENDNVLTYKYESETADVDYTLYGWEAKYLVCSNNTEYRDTITVKATIKGVGPYIDEAKKASDTKFTLLQGTPQNSYYSLFEETEGNFSVCFTISGYDYVDITSYNVRNLNKYTMFDGNGNIVNMFLNDVEADWGQTTNVRVAVPSNAVTMYVSTYRRDRADVIVYGVKMPDDFGWTNCAGSFVDYVYQGYTYYERENGSKEFTANEFDILRIQNGTNARMNNIFTAFDANGNVIGFVSPEVAGNTENYFICPKGTVKVAIAGARVASGWGTAASLAAQKRTTGKKLSVMGDSTSTYKNFLPTGNAVYYEDGEHGVPSASYLWWGVVAREKGYAISTINAWSGSQVSNTGGASATSCMLSRVNALAEKGTPDIIIILGGINDYMHESVPLGTWAGHADIPTTGDNFRAAYAMMLDQIHENYPLAKVYCCTLFNFERDLEPGSLEHRGDKWLHEFNDAIRQIAPMLNCNVIELDTCGINQYNMENYMGDYNSGTGSGLHPNAAGHNVIAQRVLEALFRQ